MKNELFLLAIVLFITVFEGCKKSSTTEVSCINHIQDGDETGTDCGGSCSPCATCYDTIQNGEETGIDCGGSCIPCVVPSCTNGIKDGNETEIDCGDTCLPCPDPPTLTCHLDTFSFVGNSGQTYAQHLGPSLRVYSYSYSSGYLNFMFLPHDVNVPTQLTTGSFIYNGESYTMGQNAQWVYDTGTVVITSIDTLRQIMSGTFGFSARRTTGSSSAQATGGVFTNVRYH